VRGYELRATAEPCIVPEPPSGSTVTATELTCSEQSQREAQAAVVESCYSRSSPIGIGTRRSMPAGSLFRPVVPSRDRYPYGRTEFIRSLRRNYQIAPLIGAFFSHYPGGSGPKAFTIALPAGFVLAKPELGADWSRPHKTRARDRKIFRFQVWSPKLEEPAVSLDRRG
jgi:hypothetical protein